MEQTLLASKGNENLAGGRWRSQSERAIMIRLKTSPAGLQPARSGWAALPRGTEYELTRGRPQPHITTSVSNLGQSGLS